ncbi:MAG: hypothetical protein JZU53_16640 [Paludibacter sp.]|nr:hypothetical protein [Paludibacter sp.]
MRKHKVSNKKQVSIQSTDLLNRPIQGKYFPIKKTDSSEYLSIIRGSFTHEYYSNLITEIEKYPYSLSNLLSSNVKKKTKELDTKHIAYIDFDSELSWAKNILIRNISSINKFLKLSKNYSEKLLFGQYKEASLILSEIEDSFGMSLWLIKNKIAFLQLTEGLEAQKKYTQNIKNEFKNGSLIRFITHWVSIRNENQTSISKFTIQIESNLNKLNPKNHFGYKEYCKYHILAHDSLDPEEIIQILRLEYSCSLIDYYEAFVNVIRVITFDESKVLKSRALIILINDKFTISDQRLELLKQITGILGVTKIDNDPAILSFKKFLTGDYDNTFLLAEKYLALYPDNPILLYVCAFAKSMIEKKNNDFADNSFQTGETVLPIKSILINSLSEIIEKGFVGSSKSFNELSKIALNFSCFQWVSAFNLFVLKENSIFADKKKESLITALKFNQIHPVLTDLFVDASISKLYLDLCFKIYGNTEVADYYDSLNSLNPISKKSNLSSNQFELLNGLIKLKSENYDEAIKSGELLIMSENGYFRRRGYGIVTRSYIGINNLVLACKYMSDCLINSRSFYSFLPLNEIISIIKTGSKEWNLVNSFIDLSIVYDACVKYVDNKYENQRRFAYEDFLTNNGANKPSELSSKIDSFDRDKIIYYLRYICIESTMDTSDAFENGSQEVLDERLAICRLLVEIDTNNEEIYKVEIKDLLRRQVIASRRKEVDQSRIYVDIQSVKDQAESEIKENFERYISYLKSGLNTVEIENNSTRINLPNNENFNTPDNEVNSLLKFMIEEVRDIYLSPEIGLDRFISTRIRHGDLERSLRSPIQNHNLITKKESKNGNYLRNDYWLNKIIDNSLHLSKFHERAFSEFSESYDNLIYSLKNEFLQIKRENKPKGLFDFTINDTSDIAKSINVDTTLDEFIDLVIRAFDSALIICLLHIREVLNTNAKSQAKKLLNKLQENTLTENCSITIELHGQINQARTEIQAQFDKVIDWFVPSSSSNSSPYIIEDAIVVAEAIIKEENPHFKIKVESDEVSSVSIHGHLPIFVDIFTNVFENVVKRSGINTPEAIIQLCSDNTIDDLIIIHIKIINKLGSDIDIKLLDSNLKRKKALLKTESYSQFLATEGNSGLFKIHKSIMDFNLVEFDVKPTMDFGVENNEFQISLSVPFRMIILDLENSTETN